VKVYEALVKGQPIPKSGVPESFRVLTKEFQALGLDITVLNDNGEYVELKDLEEEEKDSFLTTDEFEKSIDLNLLSSDEESGSNEKSAEDVSEEDEDLDEDLEEELDEEFDETEEVEGDED
ncbi:MAG: hypothetical protein PHE54_01805, partial [Bacilli bacterium]|nr:hypothetical protein [Bacilli bacterium]